MQSIHERLRAARRRAGFPSARSAATRHRWAVSTYAQHENGARKLSAENVRDYAARLGVDPGWLVAGDAELEPREIAVAFALGADWGLAPFNAAPARRVPAPSGLGRDAFAIEVHTNALTPFYRRNDVIIADEPAEPCALLGVEVVAEADLGRMVLGELRAAETAGRFHVMSPTRPILLSTRIRRVWRPLWLRRAGRSGL